MRSILDLHTDRYSAAALAAAALLLGVALALRFDVTLILPDTIQLMDAARHLLAGDGYSSSIIYYESQHQFASVPAPLTVWPPGFSLLLAAAMALGLSAPIAAFALSLLAHFAVTGFIYVGLRRVDVSPWVALVAALAWLLHPSVCTMVLASTSEPIFTGFTMASCILLAEAWRRARAGAWLIAAGACAAFAILMRYNGVLWPAAAGLWLASAAIKQRSWQPLGRAVVFGALPALTTIGLFWRNWALTGRLSGGQFEFGGAGGLGAALRSIYWESHLLFGKLMTVDGLVLVPVLAVLVGALVMTGRRLSFGQPRAVLFGLAIANFVVVAAFQLANGVLTSMVFVEYRYWIPALPFLFLCVGLVADDALTRLRASPGWTAASVPALVAVIGAAILAVSLVADLARRWPALAHVHPATRTIEQALAERVPDGRTVREVLTLAGDPEPLLANFEHRLARTTGRAVIGLTDARYTGRVWTDAETAQLVKVRGIREVIFFPTAFDPALAMNANAPFFRELYDGHPPDWLTPRYISRTVQLYDVAPSKLP